MEKVSRRYNKMLRSKKDSKSAKKDRKNRSKSENEDFFTELKKKKRGIRNSKKVVKKITTSKLTVRTKTLCNAVRSVYAVREEYFNYGEDSKALLNEDLFKIIDLGNPTPQKTHETSANIEDTTNKSIFREIEEKFQQLTPNLNPNNDSYLISDDNLQQLVSKKLCERKNLILNSWAKTLHNILYHMRANDLPELLLTRIVSNQSKINETSALFELKTKFRGVPLAGTCLRRKFTRRCNELSNLQNLGGKIIMTTQADEIIKRVNLESALEDQIVGNSDFKLKMAPTPQKQPQNFQNFAVVSYKTPESQKFSIDDNAATCSELRPAVKSKTTTGYLELDREKCTDDKFVQEYGLSREQQKYFLEEAVKAEQMQTLDLNAIFERPNKLQTERKRRSRYSIEESSPKSLLQAASPPQLTPNRKLNFSDLIDESDCQTFDFCLLEDVGKVEISPIKFGGLFTDNGARGSDHLTPKRGLESFLSPNELRLRKKVEMENQENNENIFARAKRFAAAPEELGPIPTARATPQFKFRPCFLP